MGESNCLRQQLAHGQHLQLREVPFLGNGDRVRHGDFDDRCRAEPLDGRAGKQRMRGAYVNVVRAQLLQRAGGFGDRAGRVDHVVGDEAVPSLDVTDHVQHFCHVRRWATLVDDRQRAVEPLRVTSRHLRRPDIWCDDDDVLQLLLSVVRHHHRRGIQVIDRNVEKPLQLVLVKIDAEDAIGARGLDHVGQQLCSNGDARLVLSILARIPVVGHHRRDPRRRSAPRSVDQEQQLHHVVRWRIRRLDDEHVRTTNVLVNANEDLAVGKPTARHSAQVDAELSCDLLGERLVPGAREELESMLRYGQAVHCRSLVS